MAVLRLISHRQGAGAGPRRFLAQPDSTSVDWPSFAGTSIQVFRIRDGKILLFRGYFSPRGIEELSLGPEPIG
jgi:hypothetical protein